MAMQKIQYLIFSILSAFGLYAIWCGYSYCNRASFDQVEHLTLEIFGKPKQNQVSSVGFTNKMVEIREYPAYLVVEAIYKGVDMVIATDLGLQDIGGYLLGKNSQGRKIPMTIPVSISTTPIDNAYAVSFILPNNEKIETLPAPLNKRLKLKQVPKKLMACLQWKGNFPSPSQLEHKKIKLMRYLQSTPYGPKGELSLFQYDSPYTPGWMRKNQLLYQVERRQPNQLN